MRPRRVHGWIPHYRSPADRNAIDPSWTSLLAEYGMRMGDTICGQDERRRVVARFHGEHVTCPTCRSLIASMIQRAFRVLLGMPTVGDPLWGWTPGPVASIPVDSEFGHRYGNSTTIAPDSSSENPTIRNRKMIASTDEE